MAEAGQEADEAEEALPPRLRALPDPVPLGSNPREVQKDRVKELERKLKSHAKRAFFSVDEAKQLLAELEQLKRDLATAPQEAVVEEGEESALACGETRGSTSQRLVLKREIREIERKLKAHKKQACFSKKELSELGERLEELKSELTANQASKAQQPQILTLHVGFGCSCGDEAAISAALGDRISIAGLPEQAASMLFDALASKESAEGTSTTWDASGASWSLQCHHGISSGVLFGTDAFALAAELEGLSHAVPHLLCVRSRTLRARGGICAVLRDYRGALLVIEEGGESELEAASMLSAVFVRSRWRLRQEEGGAAACLERAAVPEALKGEVLGDLKARDVKDLSSGDLGPALAEADMLCQQEFGDELVEPLAASDGVRMGLLVSAAADKADGPTQRRDFLGFVLYKFWGPPLKAMSISRVAVPAKHQMQGFGRQLVRWAIERAKQKPRHECNRVTLCSLPKAIPFYERLNFSLQEEDEGEGPPEIPGAVRMEYNYGRQVKG